MAFRRPSADNGSGDAFARYGSLGLQFVVTLGVFGLAGYGLDRWLGSFPFAFVIGMLLGGVGAMIAIVRSVPPPRGTSHSKTATRSDPGTKHR